MDKAKKIAVFVALAAIIVIAGYWFYAIKKTAVAPISGNKLESSSVTTTKTLIPEIFPIGKATLSWNANTEPDLAGYKIYYGATPRTDLCPPGGYPQKVDVGNKISYTVDKLEAGKTYYFSITSYDKSGNESCFSPEVKKIIATP